MPRVDFYVTEEASESARLQLVCRLTEKIRSQSHTVCIAVASADQARRLDDLLWTYREGSFIPHEIATPGIKASLEAPVIISTEVLPDAGCDVLVNLQDTVPELFERFERIAEMLDGDPERRKLGRERFKFYRDKGITPQTHNMGGGHDA